MSHLAVYHGCAEFEVCGSLNLARTRERAVYLKKRLAAMKPSGIKVEVGIRVL